jgi:hypothetical protein
MARYKNGINGPVSGKVGTVVGASWRGIDYLRSRPGKKSKGKVTDAQRNQRLKFSLVSGWLQPLRDLIWIGYKFFTGSKTPMNGCVGYHLSNAVVGEGTDCKIDFPKVIFSRGELLISLVKEMVSLAGAILQIKWDNALSSVFSSDDDEATFIVYNPAKEKFATFKGAALRADLEVGLQLPADFAGDTVHCYMQYTGIAGDRVSTTVYAGEVVTV